MESGLRFLRQALHMIRQITLQTELGPSGGWPLAVVARTVVLASQDKVREVLARLTMRKESALPTPETPPVTPPRPVRARGSPTKRDGVGLGELSSPGGTVWSRAMLDAARQRREEARKGQSEADEMLSETRDAIKKATAAQLAIIGDLMERVEEVNEEKRIVVDDLESLKGVHSSTVMSLQDRFVEHLGIRSKRHIMQVSFDAVKRYAQYISMMERGTDVRMGKQRALLLASSMAGWRRLASGGGDGRQVQSRDVKWGAETTRKALDTWTERVSQANLIMQGFKRMSERGSWSILRRAFGNWREGSRHGCFMLGRFVELVNAASIARERQQGWLWGYDAVRAVSEKYKLRDAHLNVSDASLKAANESLSRRLEEAEDRGRLDRREVERLEIAVRRAEGEVDDARSTKSPKYQPKCPNPTHSAGLNLSPFRTLDEPNPTHSAGLIISRTERTQTLVSQESLMANFTR